MLNKKLLLISKKLAWVQTLSKTLYNVHIYIDAHYKKMTIHPCGFIVLLQVIICYVNTRLQRIIKRFCSKSGFQSCFWSAQCIETQARTSDIVKTWVFIPLKVQWWSFIENVVFWNTLRSIKAAFLELEKVMFTGSTLVLMFNNIPTGPCTHGKQSKAFHFKCNLKANWDKKWVW